MEHASLIIIRREHRALSAMLRSTVLLLDGHRRHHTLPDFAVLLPLREAVLDTEDWAQLHAAFIANRDPLVCPDVSAEFRPLFLKIVCALPAMSGIRGALEALAGAGPPKFPWPPARDQRTAQLQSRMPDPGAPHTIAMTQDKVGWPVSCHASQAARRAA